MSATQEDANRNTGGKQKTSGDNICKYIKYVAFSFFLVVAALTAFGKDAEWNKVAIIYQWLKPTAIGTVIDKLFDCIVVAIFPFVFLSNSKWGNVLAVLITLFMAILVGQTMISFTKYEYSKNQVADNNIVESVPSRTEEVTTDISGNGGLLQEASVYAQNGMYRLAIKLMDDAYAETANEEYFRQAGKYRMEFGQYVNSIMAAGKYNSAIIRDGSLCVVGNDQYGELAANAWTTVTAVSVGDRFVMALRNNGGVSITGRYSASAPAKDPDWHDIIVISAGDCHAVGLTSTGKVVAEGFNGFGQADVDILNQVAGDRKIVAVSAGYTHTLALLEDGRVIACGDNSKGACNVDTWKNVAAIYAGTYYSAALLSDGTVKITGQYTSDAKASEWHDMDMLAAGDYFIVGLQDDGTLVAEALDKDNQNQSDEGQLDVQSLENIVAIAAGHNHLLALEKDGVIHALGNAAQGACECNGMKIEYN